MNGVGSMKGYAISDYELQSSIYDVSCNYYVILGFA